MDYVSNKQPQIEEMLKHLGISSIDELFSIIPENLKLPKIEKDDGLSEFEAMQLMEQLSQKNSFSKFKNYLGAGAYEHHVPILCSAVCQKSEFLTSYTPYQSEASQGILQALFEFQSTICALTKMDAANASLYDGASAAAEAALMALRIKKPSTHLLIAESLHPHYQAVINQYLSCHDVKIEKVPFLKSGKLDFKHFKAALKSETAAIILQSPNFFGIIEELDEVVMLAKEKKILSIVSANPLSCALFSPPGSFETSIAIGECQPLGIPLSFGGPYAGYMACREEFIRQMPGRIVGQTQDSKGQLGYVLTLQTREQHIRREKATSNICTNQTLGALSSLVAMLWYGKEGLRKLALTNYRRASFLRSELLKLPGLEILSGEPIFNEFAVRFPKSAPEAQTHFRKAGIEPGLSLEHYYPALKDYLLVAVTETKSLSDLQKYLEAARGL